LQVTAHIWFRYTRLPARWLCSSWSDPHAAPVHLVDLHFSPVRSTVCVTFTLIFRTAPAARHHTPRTRLPHSLPPPFLPVVGYATPLPSGSGLPRAFSWTSRYLPVLSRLRTLQVHLDFRWEFRAFCGCRTASLGLRAPFRATHRTTCCHVADSRARLTAVFFRHTLLHCCLTRGSLLRALDVARSARTSRAFALFTLTHPHYPLPHRTTAVTAHAFALPLPLTRYHPLRGSLRRYPCLPCHGYLAWLLPRFGPHAPRTSRRRFARYTTRMGLRWVHRTSTKPPPSFWVLYASTFTHCYCSAQTTRARLRTFSHARSRRWVPLLPATPIALPFLTELPRSFCYRTSSVPHAYPTRSQHRAVGTVLGYHL